MIVTEINQNNFSKAIALLRKNSLPTEDISDTTKLFAVTEGDEIVGTIGVEFYDSIALLRSFAVLKVARGKGVGKKLMEFIEGFVKQNGARKLVLLTTTASEYFLKKGFHIIGRADAPGEIKESSEFKSTCPSSAIVMKKDL